jgi:hypothetical protein
MARISKLLQARDITVRDVSRIISNLRIKLDESYLKDSLIPEALIGIAHSHTVMTGLFGDDFDGILKINNIN